MVEQGYGTNASLAIQAIVFAAVDEGRQAAPRHSQVVQPPTEDELVVDPSHHSLLQVAEVELKVHYVAYLTPAAGTNSKGTIYGCHNLLSMAALCMYG